MHKCIILYTNKTYEIKNINHEKLSELLGTITFVGALPEFEAFAVGSLNSSHDINPYCTNEKFFEKNVRGSVILVGSDRNGDATDLDCERIETFISSL